MEAASPGTRVRRISVEEARLEGDMHLISLLQTVQLASATEDLPPLQPRARCPGIAQLVGGQL